MLKTSTPTPSDTSRDRAPSHWRQQKQGIGGVSAAPSEPHLQNQCADNGFEQTSVCFNLALHLNFADAPPIHATTPLQAGQTFKRKSARELIAKCNINAIEEHHRPKANDSDAP